MKTIGLIGGMSWESSAVYYEILNRTVKERLGGHHSCDCLMYEELVHGHILDASRTEYLNIIEELVDRGAQGIILGCTEIPLLVRQSDCTVPVFDTTAIHALKAVTVAIQDQLATPRKNISQE